MQIHISPTGSDSFPDLGRDKLGQAWFNLNCGSTTILVETVKCYNDLMLQ